MIGIRRRSSKIFAIGTLLALGGCYRAGVEYRSGPTLAGLQSTSVVVSSNASYRLIVDPGARGASRLWVVEAHVETYDDVPLWIGSEGIQLVLADGTRARALDPPRVAALLKRTGISAEYPSSSGQGAARTTTVGMTAADKDRLRDEILSNPFVAGELGRSHPLMGYLVVDTTREIDSLSEAMLEVVATRLSDGGFVRRIYRFSAPNDTWQAGTMGSGG